MTLPTECWYALAAADEVTTSLSSVRALNTSVLLYRTEAGTAVALEDRCAHRPYPLSLGRRRGDDVECGFCGFVYGPDGVCRLVPTQPQVPLGAAVRALPVREEHGVVWGWFGAPGLAARQPLVALPWLDDPAWRTVGGTLPVAAAAPMLHESFADVTKVPFLAPELAPTVLHGEAPPLDVIVTETTVSLSRQFPAAPLPAWQASAVGRGVDEPFEHEQEGHFRSPGVWVDHWDVRSVVDGYAARLRFTQLVTPVSDRATRLLWRVSRDFTVDDPAVADRLREGFASYYARVGAALETMQQVLDADGPRPELHVAADVASIRVRAILEEMTGRLAGVPARDSRP